MPSGIYKRTINHIKHISEKNNPFYGKKHTEKTKKLNALWHSKKIGSVTINSKNYKKIKVSTKKWVRLSRHLVEKYIGYKLKKGWMVHHIDGNPLNDKLSNLYIFKNMGLHLDFEMLVKYQIINRFVLKSNLRKFRKRKIK